ncbi:MAG: ABC transporter substrate-binding protein [Aquisalimonadaceae bacterium]
MTRYLLVLVALAFAAFQSAYAVSDQQIRIAVIGDLERDNAIANHAMLLAAEIAVEHRGKTVGNAPVRIVPIDTGGYADRAVPGLRAASRLSRIDLAITIDSAETALAVHHYARDYGMVFIHSGAATNALTSDYCAPTSFQWMPGVYTYAAGARDGLADQGPKRWFYVASQESARSRLPELLEEVLMLNRSELIGGAEFKPGERNMEPYIRQAVNSGADVLGVIEPGVSTVSAIRMAYEHGLTPREKQLTALQLSSSDIRQIGLYTAAGLTTVSPFVWRIADGSAHAALVEAWSRAFYARSGIMPDAVHASVYSAIGHYLDAVAIVQDDDPGAVADQMRAMPIQDIFSENGRIGLDGQLVKDMYFVEVKRPDQSREAWDYFRVIDRFPAARVFPIERVRQCGASL